MEASRFGPPRHRRGRPGPLLVALLTLASAAACNDGEGKRKRASKVDQSVCRADRDCRLVPCCCIMSAFRKGAPVCPPAPCDCQPPRVTPVGAVCVAGRCEVAWPLPAGLGPFYGDVKSKVFHAPGCRLSRCKDCSVRFGGFKAAVLSGYRPHTSCVEEQRVLRRLSPKDRATWKKAVKGLGSSGLLPPGTPPPSRGPDRKRDSD